MVTWAASGSRFLLWERGEAMRQGRPTLGWTAGRAERSINTAQAAVTVTVPTRMRAQRSCLEVVVE